MTASMATNIWTQKLENYLQTQIWTAKAETYIAASNTRIRNNYMWVRLEMYYRNVHVCTNSKLETQMSIKYLSVTIPILQAMQSKWNWEKNQAKELYE